MTSLPPYLSETHAHCHGHSFDPIFLKFGMWIPALMTRFGIFFQLSASSNSGQNQSESTFSFQIPHSFPVLTFFPTVILTGSWCRRTLNYNPIPSYPCRYSHAKFQENRIKTVAVTVLPFFRPIWRRGHCVINYVNEPKHKRAQLDL